MGNRRSVQVLIVSSLLSSLLGLSACGKKNDETAQQAPADAPSASSGTVQPVAAAPAYTPPTADQLYQMVAPIALFPDKLVALVLAGSTYPDQVAAANTWLGQNPSLKGQALATAADQQSWDPSVKALTQFPAVLSQMATNTAWTTTLGQAYYNDPTDVLNAIQVMRQRAQASGHLRTTAQVKVAQVSATAAPADYTPASDAPSVYDGPAVIPPPPQTIVIEPAQPDVVYVPAYNPAVVYGAPVAVYPGYAYRPPVSVPSATLTAGAISFGVGVAVGAAFSHVGWGWHAWGMHWGGPPPSRPGGPARIGSRHPTVVYNHTTYVSKSTTVINRINNTRINNTRVNNNTQINNTQINNTRVNNNTQVNNTRTTNNYGAAANNPAAHGREAQPAAAAPQTRAHEPPAGAGSHPPGAMTMPHFNAGDTRPGQAPQPAAAAQTRAHGQTQGAEARPGHPPPPAPAAQRPTREQPAGPGGRPPGAATPPHPNAGNAHPVERPAPPAHPAGQPAPQHMNGTEASHAAAPPVRGNAAASRAEPAERAARPPQVQAPRMPQPEAPRAAARPEQNRPAEEARHPPAAEPAQRPAGAAPHGQPEQARPPSARPPEPHAAQPGPRPQAARPEPPAAHHEAPRPASHERQKEPG